MNNEKIFRVESKVKNISSKKLRFDLPDDGVLIIVPIKPYENLQFRRRNQNKIDDMEKDPNFNFIRLLFNLDLLENNSPKVGTSEKFEILVYFTNDDLNQVKENKTLILAYWKIKDGDQEPSWNTDTDSEIVELFEPSEPEGYIGYVRASLNKWGDPPIALGS